MLLSVCGSGRKSQHRPRKVVSSSEGSGKDEVALGDLAGEGLVYKVLAHELDLVFGSVTFPLFWTWTWPAPLWLVLLLKGNLFLCQVPTEAEHFQ